MKNFIVFSLLIIAFCLPALSQPLAAAVDDSSAVLPSRLITANMLESKITWVETADDLTDEVKRKLLQLYRKALSNLQTANSNEKAAEAFHQAIETVPVQVHALRDALDESNIPPPLETLGVDLSTPLREIEHLLQKEKADLAAVDARRADFERRLSYQQNRSAAIRQRLSQARQTQDEVAAAHKAPPTADEDPALAEAGRWVLETRYSALSAEIKMLDQELLSQPMRLDLIKAKRDKEISSSAWIGTRIKALSELVNRKRQLEAEQSKIETEAKQWETAGLDPLLTRLADQNAALSDNLKAAAARLDALDQEEKQAEQLAVRIVADYQDIQATVKTGGLSEGIGVLLVKHRKSLPDYEVYARRARARKQEIAKIGVERLRYRDEARDIADIDQTVTELEGEIIGEKTPQLREKLRDLVGQRQTLLRKALEGDEFYLKQLREVDGAERNLLNAVHAFDAFLSEHLLWLRSANPTRLKDLAQAPDEARQMFSPATWSAIARLFYNQVSHAPTFWFALVAVAVLLWKRRGLVAAVESTAKRLGKPTTDSFTLTLRTLALTFIIAAPLPLLLAATGWQLQAAAQGAELPQAVGNTLYNVALYLFILWVFRTMCIPRGLAAAHFRWSKAGVRLLRVELTRLTWILVPLQLFVLLAVNMNPDETGGALARIGFLAAYAALTFFLYRVFHPKRAVLAHLRARRASGLIIRAYPVWYATMLILPPGLIMLLLTGYVYSAVVLSDLLEHTLFLIGGLILLNALAVRWLLVVRRRLAYEAAIERRQAAGAARRAEKSGPDGDDSSVLHFEEPEVDLAALSDESRELVKFAIVATGLIGLYLIWSSVLPALRMFDDITLWHYTVSVEGEDKRLPITLADFGLAFIYVIGVGVLAKRLPAVLEIILLERFHMSAGSRYTITTLVNYTIIAVGILLVLNTIGAQWSQLQWLVAALGVGIGFGLQEIVANFISGLIILFERPIRIGDTVTVGDTEGIVTKIRIRATTILNWDNKELLVPNKEFITGRLLNWSLSDQTTRILISVGVAYGSNVPDAMRLLEEAAVENEKVLDEPAPSVIFQTFGDNALTLMLRCFVDSIDLRYPTISALNKTINDKFNKANIVIAFPQRDLHLDMSEPLRISIEDARDRSAAPKLEPPADQQVDKKNGSGN